MTGEPDEAWSAFQRYRDMHSPRRIEYAATKSATILFGWAAEWRWFERATHYDRHTDAIRRAQREEMLKQTETDRLAKAMTMLAGAENLFENELKKLTSESHASEMSVMKISELTKLMTKIIELQRLVHGESTETIAHTSDFDLSKLSLEDLRKWRELQSKVSKDGDEG